MGHRIPENDLFAKLLKGGQDRREKVVDTHLPCLERVVLLRNPHGLHRDEVSHVPSGSDICISTGGEYPVLNFNLLCYHHGIWQSTVYPSKLPQRDEESLLLDGLEFAIGETLTKPLR